MNDDPSEVLDPHAVKRAAQIDMLNFVYNNITSGFAVVVFNSFIIVLLVWLDNGQLSIFYWLLFMVLQSLTRAKINQYYRDPEHPPSQRLRMLIISSCLGGVGWGILAVVFIPKLSEPYQALIGFAIAGMSAAALSVLGAVPSTFRVYMALSVGPLMCSYYACGTTLGYAMAILVAVYLVMVLAIAKRYYLTLYNAYRLSYENQFLVGTLRLEKERAEAASHSKSRFLANMSHEIRTPMIGVIGSLELLAQDDLTNSQKNLLDVSQHSAEHLLELLNEILDLSKIEAGKMALNPVPINLDELIQKLRLLFENRAKEKGLNFDIVGNTTPAVEVLGDDLRITQVLCNLLSNAIKFTDTGYIRLHIDSKPADLGFVCVSICVSDTGVGIEKTKQESLFDAFLQADSSNSRAFSGTGLGLAIAKQLIELMGGEIAFESEPGQGSRFSFELRLKAASECDVMRAVSDEKPEVMQAFSEEGVLPSARVLLVEDNPINQQINSALLRRLDMEVVTAENGIRALEHLKKEKFDIVFMDCQMPVMDGFEATRLWRAYEAEHYLTKIPIVALTAQAMEGDRESCLAEGMDEYLLKPVKLNTLGELLRRWLAHGP